MKTPYKCACCGTQISIESQGDMPLAITAAERATITVGGVEYPLRNEKGESLKNVLNGKAEYWTPPAPEAPAAQ